MSQKVKDDILHSIVTGENHKALSYLYEKTLQKVRKYILSNKGTKEESDDIFQDAVIIFFQQVRLGKFDPKFEIDAYIYIVARNLWINKVRRDKRMTGFEYDGQFENIVDFTDHLKNLIDREKSNALKEVFEKLDEKCKKILHYSIFEKLSMKEISEKMGYTSVEVAKTNNYRCKKYLSNLVKKDQQLYNLLKE